MKENDNTIGRTEAIFKLVLENNIELRMIRQLLIDQQTHNMTEFEKKAFADRYNLEVAKQSKEAEEYLLGRKV
ncbi:MAG: hypothetical protein ABIS36_12270 [Chryseolinea sp.]